MKNSKRDKKGYRPKSKQHQKKRKASKKHCISGKIDRVSVERIKPDPGNARTHSRKQTNQIANSIGQFGFTNPILVDEKSVIIAGHGRLEAARQLGLTKVPVIRIHHLNKAQKRALMLADNKIAENAGWDFELLAAEFEELSVELPDLGFDLELTGFSTGEIDSILDDHEGRSSEPAEIIEPINGHPPVSQRGQLWQLGKHRLICGDSRDPNTASSLFGDELAIMVITDPPYNVRIKGHVGGRGKVKHQEFAFASGEMSDEQYQQFLKQTLQNIVRVSTEGALIYSFIDWRHVEGLLTCGRGLRLILKNICVWNKTTPGQGSFYRSAHELVVVFQKAGANSINNIELGKYGRNRTNVWSYPGVNTFRTGKRDELAIHPTVKPVGMIAEAIKDASRRNDVVFDPFIGSGTTILAAEKVGRRCYGVEYEPKYVDTAIRRWQELTGKDAVLLADNVGLDFTSNADQENIVTDSPLLVTKSPNAPNAPSAGSFINLTFDEVEQLLRDRGVSEVPLNTQPEGEAS
jgi:DNA modification methylase